MKTFILIITLLTFLFVPAVRFQAAADDSPSDEIKKAAINGINTLIKGHSIDKHFRNLGFESQSDIDNAELGEGFQIYAIDTSKLLNELSPQDIQSTLFPTGQWLFLVQNKGKAKSLLTISFFNGEWAPVTLGSSTLAREMAGFLAAWPASSDYKYRFIEVYQNSSTLIEVSQGSKVIGVIPLSTLIMTQGRETGSFAPNDLKEPKDILPDLSNSVKRNIELYKEIYNR